MIYRFHEFAADVQTGVLTRAGSEVHLRRKSFQVLALLLNHHSRLVSKEEIFASVWPELAVTDDVLVGVIGELRKALGDNTENPIYIRTSRRAGYRFIAPVEMVSDAPAPAVELMEAPPAAARQRPRGGVWLAAGLLVGMAGGYLLAKGFRPHLPVRAPAPLREVAWWRFEGSGTPVDDVSRNGNAGELRGGAARIGRPVGNAVELDGVRGWVCGDAKALPMAGEPMTFTAWVLVRSTHNDFTNIFQFGYRYPSGEVPFRYTLLTMARPDGRWEAGASGEGTPLVGGPVADGRWHHLAVRYEGAQTGNAALYMDGAEQARGKWYRPLPPHANEAWSMGQYIVPATFFHGSIGDARVYNRPLRAHVINALYRCSSGEEALSIAGESYFYLPLYADVAEVVADPANGRMNGLRNPGKYYAGMQFAKRTDACSIAYLQGADMGQDLHISVELLTPRDESGRHTQAGPYFRSRLAAPGDGIMGGTSAGYWVALDSNGTVTVRRLNPMAVVAYASVGEFDPAVYHPLEMVAVGSRLQVKLDGKLVTFEQDGRQGTSVAIPPVWNGPPAIGKNEGAAGIEFAAIDSHGEIGGQAARRVKVERASKLWE